MRSIPSLALSASLLAIPPAPRAPSALSHQEATSQDTRSLFPSLSLDVREGEKYLDFDFVKAFRPYFRAGSDAAFIDTFSSRITFLRTQFCLAATGTADDVWAGAAALDEIWSSVWEFLSQSLDRSRILRSRRDFQRTYGSLMRHFLAQAENRRRIKQRFSLDSVDEKESLAYPISESLRRTIDADIQRVWPVDRDAYIERLLDFIRVEIRSPEVSEERCSTLLGIKRYLEAFSRTSADVTKERQVYDSILQKAR